MTHPIHHHTGHMTLASGKKLNLVNPTVDEIEISDIACALSKIPHWGGHTKEFFSVAQHSVLVWTLTDLDHGKRLAALLHDAQEAYLGDVIKPLKLLLGVPYTLLERTFHHLICEKFNVDPYIDIKAFDNMANEMEYDFFFGGKPGPMQRMFGSEYPCWEPEIAREMFLSVFHETIS